MITISLYSHILACCYYLQDVILSVPFNVFCNSFCIWCMSLAWTLWRLYMYIATILFRWQTVLSVHQQMPFIFVKLCSITVSLSLSVHFNGHFPAGPRWVITMSPNQQCLSTEGKLNSITTSIKVLECYGIDLRVCLITFDNREGCVFSRILFVYLFVFRNQATGIQKSLGQNQQNAMPVTSPDKLGGLWQEGHPA